MVTWRLEGTVDVIARAVGENARAEIAKSLPLPPIDGNTVGDADHCRRDSRSLCARATE